MAVDKDEAIKILEKQEREQPDIITNSEAESVFSILENQSETAELEAQEKREIMEMRKKWSVWILISIVAITVFDILFIIAIGRQWLIFGNSNSNIVPVFITESLIKTIGLAIIIVKFLFNKDGINSVKK